MPNIIIIMKLLLFLLIIKLNFLNIMCINYKYDNFTSLNNNKLLLNNINNNEFSVNNYNVNRERRSPIDICSDTYPFIKCNCEKTDKPPEYRITCIVENGEHTLGHLMYLHYHTKVLIIKLSNKSRLTISQGFFHLNKIQSIIIEGINNINNNNDDNNTNNNQEHLELMENALIGNNALFPEIKFQNLHTIVIHKNCFRKKSEYKLYIENVQDLIIQSLAFEYTTFIGYFINIYRDLILKEDSFKNANNSSITLKNCNIKKLRQMDPLKLINITDSIIDRISKNAFNKPYFNTIIFHNTKINVIESQAFTEKLYSENFLDINHCEINTIESEAIANISMPIFYFRNNNVTEIKSNGISFIGLNVTITSNRIKILGYKWVIIYQWDFIEINNNTFNEYNLADITSSPNSNICLYKNNIITKPIDNSLNFTYKKCIIDNIAFYKECQCNTDWLKKLSSYINLYDVTYCRIEDVLKNCFNATTIKYTDYYNKICSNKTKELDCIIVQKTTSKSNTNFIHPLDRGNNNHFDNNFIQKYLSYIIIIACSIILIIIIVISIVVIKKIYQKRNQQTMPMTNITNNDTQNQFSLGHHQQHNQTTITNQFDSNHKLIMNNNQSRLFTNEDRNIINRTLNIMKIKHSNEKYESVYNNTKKLLNLNLKETEKVIIIGDIISTLDECENSGEDFVAFTDILYKHLEPKNVTHLNTININDPVYEEPNLLLQQTNNTIGQQQHQHQHQTIVNNQNNHNDHIYAELNSVEQPLLLNEYASPVDKNNEQNALYSEPINININNPKDDDLVNPYAVGQANNYINNNNHINNNNNNNLHQPSTSSLVGKMTATSPQLPSTSLSSTSAYNLPDVLLKTNNILNFNNNSNNNNNNNNASKLNDDFLSQYTVPNKQFKKHNNLLNNQQQQKPKVLHTFSEPQNNQHKDLEQYQQQPGCSYNTDFINCHNPVKIIKKNSTSSSSSSEHSGGSDITVKIDDIIEYADADLL